MKKAMSPLFSTIVLIGFAIALGGIIMSWGKEGYGVLEQTKGCEQTSLALISYGENRGICNKGNVLYFTIQNNGEINLDGVKVFVISENEVYPTIIDKQINVADIVNLNLELQSEYTLDKKIKKIIFVPKFEHLTQEKLCPKNGFAVEDIGEC